MVTLEASSRGYPAAEIRDLGRRQKEHRLPLGCVRQGLGVSGSRAEAGVPSSSTWIEQFTDREGLLVGLGGQQGPSGQWALVQMGWGAKLVAQSVF